MGGQTETVTNGSSAGSDKATKAGCYRCGAADGTMVQLCAVCKKRDFNIEDEHARLIAELDQQSMAGQQGFLWTINRWLTNPVAKVLVAAAVLFFVGFWITVVVPSFNPKPPPKKSAAPVLVVTG